MKINFLLACIAALCLSSCYKEKLPVPKEPGQSNRADTSYTVYKILKGRHYCIQSTLYAQKSPALSFSVKFDSSAIYKTSIPENQSDINKLFGFSDNTANNHEYSARFGWRWSNNALQIFAYTYNDGVRSIKDLGSVAIGRENTFTILASGNEYVFKINGSTSTMPRNRATAFSAGYRLFPYFGGDEMAPHEITIRMKEILVDSQ